MLRTGKKQAQDEALTADASKKKKSKKDIECFNCKKRGHMKSDCWAKGGGKEGQGPKKRTQEGAAVASEQQQPDIEAWAAVEESAVEGSLQVFEAWAVDEEAAEEEESQQVFASKSRTESELYDSGVSCHMSPFRQQFISYRPITPRPIMAADKRFFYANGIGDLRIKVPNGESFTPMILQDALYAPEMALTVVSISRIAKAGFSVSFEGNSCKIANKNGAVVGTVPTNNNGLYRVEHVCAVSPINEVVDIPTLHRRMGHTAADSIRTLVRSGAILGVSIIDDGQPLYCESCEYAKATRKAIKKEREGAQASAFGEEIHSDLWGPSPLQTLGSRKYYITFTDDYSRFTRTQLLRTKDEALQAYKDFVAWAQTQHGVKIK